MVEENKVNSKEGYVTVFAPSTGGMKLSGSDEWINPHDAKVKESIKKDIKKGDYVSLILTTTGAIVSFSIVNPPANTVAPVKAPVTNNNASPVQSTKQMVMNAHAPKIKPTSLPEEIFRPASSDVHLEEVYSALSVMKAEVEKKGHLTYVSWADAWAEVKKKFPGAQYIVYENSNGMPYFSDHTGAMVKVGVIIKSHEYVCWLPVMNSYHKSIPVEQITTFDINKTIQRALAKGLAYHGYALYVYRGEDLPEDSTNK